MTYMVKSPYEFKSNGYVWKFLKDEFSINVTDKIQFMKKFKDNKGVVFDVPEQAKEELDKYIEKQQLNDFQKGMKLSLAQEIPELADDNYATGNSTTNIIQSKNSYY